MILAVCEYLASQDDPVKGGWCRSASTTALNVREPTGGLCQSMRLQERSLPQGPGRTRWFEKTPPGTMFHTRYQRSGSDLTAPPSA